jgi:3-methylfumaryl-CoA hydratase
MTHKVPIDGAELTLDAAVLERWLGKSQRITDTIDASTCARMSATLGLSKSPVECDALPPLWHWLFFHMPVSSEALAADGHERLGGFLPPVGLPRRMWAGGRLWFEKPLCIGDRALRVSTITSIERKRGRSGELCFVTIRHVISVNDGVCVVEEHDIVYREAAVDEKKASAVPSANAGYEAIETKGLIRAPLGDNRWLITPTVSLLFRYSALTFNSHRIHYDREYCINSEGYPGLVFHGPLTATLLADAALREQPGQRLTRFEFRARRALFDTEAFEICVCGGEQACNINATNSSGQVAMEATARFVAA